MAKVHVEDLCNAVNTFYSDMRKALTSPQQVAEAQAKFRKFCEDNGIDLDWNIRT